MSQRLPKKTTAFQNFSYVLYICTYMFSNKTRLLGNDRSKWNERTTERCTPWTYEKAIKILKVKIIGQGRGCASFSVRSKCQVVVRQSSDLKSFPTWLRQFQSAGVVIKWTPHLWKGSPVRLSIGHSKAKRIFFCFLSKEDAAPGSRKHTTSEELTCIYARTRWPLPLRAQVTVFAASAPVHALPRVVYFYLWTSWWKERVLSSVQITGR